VNRNKALTIDEFSQWTNKHRHEIEGLLHYHGVILWRSFPTPHAEDLSKFVLAFSDWEDLPYEVSLSYAIRKQVCARVCTTNEGKTGGMVFHHEQAQTPLFPGKIFFFCEEPATIGGGTGISHSGLILDQLTEKFPDFVKQLEAKGVIYKGVLPEEPDTSSGQVGRDWKSFFGRKTKEEVEKRATELGYKCSWQPDKSLHFDSPILPAIRVAPGSNGVRVFFNQMIAAFKANFNEWIKKGNSKETYSLDKFLIFGDGGSIPVDPMEFLAEQVEKNAFDLSWQAGDVGLLDNYMVMHARRAYEGPRKVFASLCL
jgi:alpha-ketoglutarate-dependent taurine dioxygenase